MTAKMSAPPPNDVGLYHADVVAWTEEQANPLRSGRLSELDIDHIAE